MTKYILNITIMTITLFTKYLHYNIQNTKQNVINNYYINRKYIRTGLYDM